MSRRTGRPAAGKDGAGRAWITGISNYVLQDADPFWEGYTVGDIG